MRKIDCDYENPLDNILLHLAEDVSPFFKKLNFTPNDITTLSLLFTLMSIYYLYIKDVKMFALSYFIAYFFDCLDGHFARKYEMVTKFGDTYDHVKDVLGVVGLLGVLFMIHKKPILTFAVIPFIIVAVLSQFHLMCQQLIHNFESDTKIHEESLDSLIPFFQKFVEIKTKEDAEMCIHYTKYAGCGTTVVALIIYIVFMMKYK